MAIRITAPIVDTKVEEHLRDHKAKGGYDEMLNQHHKTLYGENLDDGLCYDVKHIMTLKGYAVAVILAIVIDIATRYIK